MIIVKSLVFASLFVSGKSQSTFEDAIQKNRRQTISMLNDRLSVVESDIIDVQFMMQETSAYHDLSSLNNTLFQDKESIESIIKIMNEQEKK